MLARSVTASQEQFHPRLDLIFDEYLRSSDGLYLAAGLFYKDSDRCFLREFNGCTVPQTGDRTARYRVQSMHHFLREGAGVRWVDDRSSQRVRKRAKENA